MWYRSGKQAGNMEAGSPTGPAFKHARRGSPSFQQRVVFWKIPRTFTGDAVFGAGLKQTPSLSPPWHWAPNGGNSELAFKSSAKWTGLCA